MPSTNIPIPEKGYFGTSPSARKTTDELRRQVTKLKADLEIERNKLKQSYRDRGLEIKRIQENSEREKQKAVENVLSRLQTEHAVELKRVREQVAKEKETELRQVVKFKEEEAKALKQQIAEVKDSNKQCEEELRRLRLERGRGDNDHVESERKMRNEIHVLREQKHKAEEMYRLKASSDSEKAETIKRLKADHEAALQKLIKESKKESAKDMQHIRSTEKALEDKSQELAFKEKLARKLEAERDELARRRSSVDLETPRRSRLLDAGETNDTNDIHRRDRERELKKKNSELQSQVEVLEKKCALLEKHIKHGSSPQKTPHGLEEKVKKLKKRNSELVSIARQLEEKAKTLQEEKNVAVKQAEGNKVVSSPDVQHVKRVMARQRAKDLAEHARALMSRDQQIEEMRAQLQMGKNSGSSTEDSPSLQNGGVEELQLIIRQAAKERLWLERQLSQDGPLRTPSPSRSQEDFPDLQRRFSDLEDENRNLRGTSSVLQKAEAQNLKLAAEVKQKTEENEQLLTDLEEKQKKCSRLELERERFVAKCTIVQKKNGEMEKKLKELQGMEEEVETLRSSLTEVEAERTALNSECAKLKNQVQELLQVKQELRTSRDKVVVLEQQNQSSTAKLLERDQEIQELHRVQEEANRVHELAVTALEDTMRSLEQKCTQAEDHCSALTRELEQARRTQPTNHKSTQTAAAVHSNPPSSRPALESKVAASYQEPSHEEVNPLSPHTPPGEGREMEEAEADRTGQTTEKMLDSVALRIKALVVSDSDEDTLTSAASDKKDPGNQPSQEGEDELALLSRRIGLAAASDDSSLVSGAEDGYGSDASQEGDLEDNQRDSSAPEDEQLEAHDEQSDEPLAQNGAAEETAEEAEGLDPAIQEKLSVYIARYSYDPASHSPNDIPDSELAFQAGDYLYVFGDMDEDGFFVGELMSGQRGLVPSNFVEKVADENDMNWAVNGTGAGYEDLSDSSDEEETDGKLHRALRLSTEHIPDSKLGDIKEADDEVGADANSDSDASREVQLDQPDGGLASDDTDLEPFRVPSPSRLSLERQFTQSVLVSWKPAELDASELKGYAVYVDDEFRTLVKGSSKTKALVENIDPEQTHRISIKTITTKGEESSDRQATLTIGKDATLAPSQLEVTSISPTSAKIEWLPGNSSFCHEVVVNGTPQRLLRPGTCQHTLTNLEPDQEYKVHVRTKNRRRAPDQAQEEDIDCDPLAASVLFRTEPGGLPDPPLDVEVAPAPPDGQPRLGALEVNWIPVTITDQGTSNGARVTGYKVYINGSACGEVTCPTADCVRVAPWMVERAAKRSRHGNALRLVVRTQSLDGESSDSNSVELPPESLEFASGQLIKMRGAESAKAPRPTVMVNGYEELPPGSGEPGNQVVTSEEGVAGPDGTEPLVRTKGEPVVWRLEVDEPETGDSTQGDSSNDDDEEVEICTPLEQNQNSHNTGGQEVPYEHLAQEEDDVPESDQLHSLPTDDASGQAPETERDGFPPQEELHLPVKAMSPSSPTREDSGSPRASGKMPFIRPLEYEESDSEEEEESVNELSVIHEEDEDVTESRGPPSRLSNTHSVSDGFRSEDDVMDLLEEDDVSPNAVGFEESRKQSRDEKQPTAVVRPTTKEPSVDPLAEYLERSEMVSEPEPTPEFTEIATAGDAVERSGEPEADYDMDGEEAAGSPQQCSGLTAVEGVPGTGTPGEEEAGGEVPGEEIRVFIALYDYDPATMSPNPGAEEEELSFKEGDLLRVYGDKDDDGFYWGDLDGQEGYVPFNMVSEVNFDEYDMNSGLTSPAEHAPHQDEASDVSGAQTEESGAESLLKPEAVSMSLESSTDDVVLEESGLEDPRQSKNYDLVPRRMVALFDYDPSTLSPNPDSEVELTFRVGDVIYVYGDMDEDGFFTGELRGVRGLVPSNFLEDLPDTPEAPSLDTPRHNSTLDSSSSSFEQERTPNGTSLGGEETPKKKKGILSKGKQMFKKIAKSQNNSKGQRSPKK